jgi:PEGA domain
MNLFIKILFLLPFIFIENVYSQECEAHITIDCDIENVNIFIDDSLAGSGKLFETDLNKGIYRIIIMENSDRWDAKTIIDTLNISNCEDVALQYQFKDKILLNTEPEDAYVFSNDSLIGYTPLLISSGVKNLRLEKPGFETKSIDDSEIKSDTKIKLNFIGQYDDGVFFDKTLFKILICSMVALGAATAYFKLEADRKFDEFKITGDPSFLDQTNRLDAISAVTFVALQLNFGAMIYFFLSD